MFRATYARLKKGYIAQVITQGDDMLNRNQYNPGEIVWESVLPYDSGEEALKIANEAILKAGADLFKSVKENI